MSILIERPAELQINAWNPNAPNKGPLQPVRGAGLERPVTDKQLKPDRSNLGPPAPPDPEDWRSKQVGWGLVLRDDPKLSDAEKARGEDAPAPLRKLLKARGGAPVLRWSNTQTSMFLRRYYVDGPHEDLLTATPTYGVERGCIPQYLLLYGTPDEIPWAVQYALNLSLCVGRLDLSEKEGLANYVYALINDWEGDSCDPRMPVVWSVDYGEPDITWLMARTIADPLANLYEADSELARRVVLQDRDATGDRLIETLTQKNPGLVVTTSHGMTGPLNDKEALVAQLGLLVDSEQHAVPLAAFDNWRPNGAIWYAHACCAAGSDRESRFANLVDPGSGIGSILTGVATQSGARVAPLPRKLLGASTPLRAFIGHVEPTFDWTLLHPLTKQMITRSLQRALYNNIYQKKRTPVSWALREVYKASGVFYGQQQDAIDAYNRAEVGAHDQALFRQIAAMDLQNLVLLGDPTVALKLT